MHTNRIGYFFLLIGGSIIGAAFFAESIGLDNDPGWGQGRIAILVLGVFIAACGMFYSLYAEKVLPIFRKFHSLTFQQILPHVKSLRDYWYIFPAIICVILVYIWFASSGSWINWVSPTRYYADLANGFEHGKLYLLIRPSSDLLNLPNPYDPLARQSIEFPIDYCLYNGKFYLYWGPVPALLLVMINPFVQGRVGDLYLVFSFVCGIFLVQVLLAVTIWQRFFRDLPKWLLPLSIAVIGLTPPWTYILINEPNGRIYEAAISGAQFFLMGGILVAVIAMRKPVPSDLALALTGILWALAIGTRLVMALPVGFITLMIAYRLWRTMHSSPMNLIVKLAWLSFPLILCLVGLGWYNWARFGSVTETGFSYALAGVNLQKYQNDLFSPVYVIQNLYNYFLQRPSRIAQFPFLYPDEGLKTELFRFYSLPEVYETNPVTGLLFVAPFTIFAFLSIVMPFMKARGVSISKTNGNDSSDPSLNWIITGLLGVFFSAFCLLLIFFWAALRYMGDFMPALTMLSIVGFWQGYQLLDQRPAPQKIYAMLGILFAGTSAIISILLSLAVK